MYSTFQPDSMAYRALSSQGQWLDVGGLKTKSNMPRCEREERADLERLHVIHNHLRYNPD